MSFDARALAEIRKKLLAHYRLNRRALPWRVARPDPYGIWVCEIMAQQTQIDRVAEYWTRWMARFPTVTALAAAPLDEVLAAWAGLGYYARARGLHAAARLVVERHGGRLPDSVEGLRELPGIGPYTAGAIASIAFGRRSAAVDGNVARVLARLYALEHDVRAPRAQADLWALAGSLVPARSPGDWNQALFDLGATVCTPRTPSCASCPLKARCRARAQGREGELPVAKKKTAVRAVAVDAALVVRGDEWLLCRRVPSGLYGGLWELPEIAALEAAGARLRVDRTAAPLAQLTRQLTHRTVHHRVFAARLTGTPAPAPPYDAARFVDCAELGEIGVSSATSALIRALGASKSSWPTHPKRSRSSSRATPASSRG